MTTVEMILGAAAVLMGGGNVYNWLASRGKTKVDLIALAQTIASETITALKADRSEMTAEITYLGALIEDLKYDVRALMVHVGKLEDEIRARGGTPPARPARKVAE